MTNKNKNIDQQIAEFFSSGREVIKVKEGERAMKEFVWYKETYPKNYKLRYSKWIVFY